MWLLPGPTCRRPATSRTTTSPTSATLTEHVSLPGLLPDIPSNGNATATNQYFASAAWTNMWRATNWNNEQMMKMNNSDVSGSDATYPMVNSPNNIYIERNTDAAATSATYMTMRTARMFGLPDRRRDRVDVDGLPLHLGGACSPVRWARPAP